MRIKRGGIFFKALLVMLIVLFTYICFDGAINVTNTLNASGKEVELNATITKIDTDIKIEEGFERQYWKVYVSYNYNGTKYTDVYYEQTYDEPEYGSDVKIKINPNTPDKLLPDKFEFIISLILPPIFLTGVSLAVYSLLQPAAAAIISKKGSDKAASDPKLPRTVAFLLIAIILFVESIIFIFTAGSFIFAIFAVIAFVASFFVSKKKLN